MMKHVSLSHFWLSLSDFTGIGTSCLLCFPNLIKIIPCLSFLLALAFPIGHISQ